MPENRTPAQIRDEVLELLTQRGLPQTLTAFKTYVSNRSEAYRRAVEMEVRYNELQREYLAGQISKDDENVESNRLTNSFIDLLDRLETEPALLAERRINRRNAWRWGATGLLLLAVAAAAYLLFPPEPDDQPPPTAGQVLYKIPPQMEMGRETECIVRIAPVSLPESTLSEGIADTVQKKIEPIRIGDIMTVDLVDADAAFRVAPKSTREQLIEADDYTEWKFDVTPLKAGRHELTLKITVRVRLDSDREVVKDVLVLERDIEILSEPVRLDTSFVQGQYLPFTADRSADGEPTVEDVPEPQPVPETPPEPVVTDTKDRPSGENKGQGETTGNKGKGPVTEVRPARPGQFRLCKEGFELKTFLLGFAEKIEAQNIRYNSEPLSDCSGIFLRLCNALREECPNALFPGPEQARDSRAIAQWFARHENFQIVTDAAALNRKIEPGMVMFYGQQGRSYQDMTVESLTREDGIEHVGVVVSVQKDAEGNVTNYSLFHGRSGDKPAGRTNHHERFPTRSGFPSYGNGDQQLVATAFILTMPQGI